MAKYKVYGSADAQCCVIRMTGAHELATIDNEIEELGERIGDDNWCVITYQVDDWNWELTPWNNENSSEKAGGAQATLDVILQEVIPDFEKKYPGVKRRYNISGYSLAGLFALWAVYQCDIFEGVAAVSPSVWYPGWIEYATGNKIKADKVYLSLGNKEHKTRNKQMATVKECIEKQYELVGVKEVASMLEWNEGNHFANVTSRMVKGISCLITKRDVNEYID